MRRRGRCGRSESLRREERAARVSDARCHYRQAPAGLGRLARRTFAAFGHFGGHASAHTVHWHASREEVGAKTTHRRLDECHEQERVRERRDHAEERVVVIDPVTGKKKVKRRIKKDVTVKKGKGRSGVNKASLE